MQAEQSIALAGAAQQRAPSPGSAAPRRIEAPDPRADGRRRVVLLARDRVEIARSVAGVYMHLTIAPNAYRGVLLRLTGASEYKFRYEVLLAHRDPDLNIVLAEADDDSDIQAEWRLWARFLGLPTLVERQDGRAEPEFSRLGKIAIAAPGPRRRGRILASRRARFLVRRKTGRAELAIAPTELPREIFSGPKQDR